MVCEIVCIPAIAIMAWLANLFGLPESVVSLFLGALVVGLSELESNFLKKKFAVPKGKKVLFPFQTASITIFNLILISLLLNWGLLKP